VILQNIDQHNLQSANKNFSIERRF